MIQSEQFFKFMCMVENDKLFKTKEDRFCVHLSPEGGLDTVGYGHKLNVLEKSTDMVYGFRLEDLTEEACRYILTLDLDRVSRTLSKKVGEDTWNNLTQRVREMLVDMEFNLGSVEGKFPKFYRACIAQDIYGQRNEYKRFYRDSLGHIHELRRRNRLFYSRYLSPLAVAAWN